MSTTEILIIAAVVVVAIVVIAFLGRRRRTEQLRHRFGPEYARAVEESGGAAKAEHALAEREKRVRKYPLKSLSSEERQRFAGAWEQAQARFVDSPADATAAADDLLGQVMSARGYPQAPFDQRLEDLSVEHAGAVQGYRAAHEVVVRRTRGEATTEDMRQAIINYRRMFEELVGDPGVGRAPPAAETVTEPAAAQPETGPVADATSEPVADRTEPLSVEAGNGSGPKAERIRFGP